MEDAVGFAVLVAEGVGVLVALLLVAVAVGFAVWVGRAVEEAVGVLEDSRIASVGLLAAVSDSKMVILSCRSWFSSRSFLFSASSVPSCGSLCADCIMT